MRSIAAILKEKSTPFAMGGKGGGLSLVGRQPKPKKKKNPIIDFKPTQIRVSINEPERFGRMFSIPRNGTWRCHTFSKQKGVCHYCLKETDPRLWTIDHVIPISMGGSTHDENLIGCCDECNGQKGAQQYGKFMKSEYVKWKRGYIEK